MLMRLFDTFDGTQPTGTGLVNISGLQEYFNPVKGEPEVPVFVDSESKESNSIRFIW